MTETEHINLPVLFPGDTLSPPWIRGGRGLCLPIIRPLPVIIEQIMKRNYDNISV